MKRRSATAIIAASWMAFGGQAQTPMPAPAASPPPATAKAQEPAKGGPWGPADARVCLQFESNLQVIQCAEKFRYKKAPA